MTDKLLFLDFETSSHTDLVHSGLDRYLNDVSTVAYCLTFRLPGMTTADLWQVGQPMPKAIVQHLTHGLFVAHNAPFDFWIWNQVLRRQRGYEDLPQLAIEQTRCTAARARYNGLPGSLAGACDALNLPIRKDRLARNIMLEVASNPSWTPETHPAHFARVFDYALTDTNAMYGLWHATVPLPEHMQREFELDMRINARGFGVDVDAAAAMEEIKEHAAALLDYQVAMLTQGNVLAITEVAKIKQYASSVGEEIDDAGREALKQIVERQDIPNDLRDLLKLRLDASRAPKKSAAILRAHVGGRIRHATVFHGALSGRSTARGAGNIQLLNVARPRPGKTAEQCEAYLDAAVRRDIAYLSSAEHGPLLAALADAQRSLFCATQPGHVLVDADESGIEARMAAWLANDEAKLYDFEHNIDGYKRAAMAIFGITYDEVTKDQRQVGKIADLSLGFGGGEGAFGNMANAYGVKLPPDEVADIVFKWRAARPQFERWWAEIEYAALIALDQPRKEIAVRVGRHLAAKVVFVCDGTALRMQLPSGRAISYHNARLQLEPGATAPIAVYDKPEGYVETLDRKILSNNMTQGLARDLFWAAMCDIDRVEPIVHHVYDQIILEVPEDRAELRLQQMIERLRMPPAWAAGLPLDAEGYVNKRWRKD